MNLFNKLSKQAKRLYFKAKNYKRLLSATAMNILVGCMIQIGILYLVHFSGILVESPRNIELLGMGAMLTAIIFPVTLIITSKIPIIRFRIYSNYRHGFNSVIGCLVWFLILGFISKILPNINTQAIALWIKSYIQPFDFLNHNRLWLNCILEIEMFLGVIYLILRIIWLAANPIKFRKRKSKNIYREARILIDSKDEDTIELLISELMSNFNYKKIVQLAISEPYLKFNTSKKKSLVPIKCAQELLDLLFDSRLEDNLFLQIVVKKRDDFLITITDALKDEYKKNPAKVYVQLQKLILINPIIEAFKLNDTLQFKFVLSVIFDRFSEKLDASNMILTTLKMETSLGFQYLLFNNTSIASISQTDFGKYLLIINRLLSAQITLDDLKTLYFDIIFLQDLFGSLYKKDDSELSDFLKVILYSDDLIQILKSLVVILSAADSSRDKDAETKRFISNIKITILGAVPNILGILARAMTWGGINFSIVGFCKKLFDSLFKDTQLKDYHFGEEEDIERDLLCHFSDSICGLFLNNFRINYSLIPKGEESSFKHVVQSVTNRSLPLLLFFQIYPLKDLKHIIDKKEIELLGNEIIAMLVFYLISENIIESTNEELPQILRMLSLPWYIKHQFIDGKHYLIEMKDGVETKLALSYDFSK